MPEIDEFYKIAEGLVPHIMGSTTSCADAVRNGEVRKIAQALREVHDRGYREGLEEGRDPKY